MKQRSLIGPLLLIAAGLVWLLMSMKVIPAGNLWALVQAVPYILMGFGAALLLRARWPLAGTVFSALVLIGALLAVVFAPQLGWDRPVSWGFGMMGFGGAVPGSGKLATDTRTLGDFSGIAIRYPAEVTIRQGNSQSATIEADDNLVSQIGTDIRNGTLYIDNNELDWAARVDPSRTVKITINVKDLNDIVFSGAGTVRVEGLSTEQLKVALSGAGEMNLSKLKVKRLDGVLSGAGNIKADGTADEVSLTISGLGSLNAPELDSLSANIRISGSGSATLGVKDQLNAMVSGAGSIYYYGSPSVTQRISGVGSVRQAK
ncbi:MAG: head GIN domain-containing protein [Bacteroidota bacterium]